MSKTTAATAREERKQRGSSRQRSTHHLHILDLDGPAVSKGRDLSLLGGRVVLGSYLAAHGDAEPDDADDDETEATAP